ncbi:MAG: TRAP transporter substrate-binding protein [Oscillospiraceae bacterium]
MKTRILAALLVLAMAFSLAACGGSTGSVSSGSTSGSTSAASGTSSGTSSDTSSSAADAFDKAYTWSLASTYATGTPMVEGFQKFADLLNEYSGGAITLNVFADSSLLDENDSFLSLKSGELEFAGYGTTPLYLYSEDYGFLMAPFLINSKEAYQNIYSSDLFQTAVKYWQTDYNTRDLAGMAYRGFRNMSSDRPINTVDDLKSLKLRMSNNQIWCDIWNSLGATTVPIALGELYTSIQNGAAQASEGPWEQMKSLNLDEVQDYIIETRHICETVGIWMAEDLYESLPANYQEVIDKASQEAVAYMGDQCAAREENYKQQLIDGGCEYIQPDLSGFMTTAEGIWNDYFTNTWKSSTLDEVQSIMSGK